MEDKEDYDWLSFILSFVFAAIPTWFVVGMVVWKYSPNTAGSTVFLIATISGVIFGVVAGIWRNGFWSNAVKIAKHSPYSREEKK